MIPLFNNIGSKARLKSFSKKMQQKEFNSEFEIQRTF